MTADRATTPLDDTLIPYFQPIYDLRDGSVAGFEALARLRTPSGIVGPDLFLPALDADGLSDLFLAMVRGALAFLGHDDLDGTPYVTVNVGPATMLRSGFVEGLALAIDDSGIGPDRLVLEMLEDTMPDADAVARVLRALKAVGVRLALDDVGSAYSSLARIKDLPIDVLKLDRDFARKLAGNAEDLQFVASLLGLSRSLGRVLVVEGVETTDVLEALSALGVTHAQGYALGRPAPANVASRSARLSPYEKVPTTLLGAYAAHLVIVEACRHMAEQPLGFRWSEAAHDPHLCCVGRFLDRSDRHGTAYGLTHKAFHRSLRCDGGDGLGWREAAEALRVDLAIAVADESRVVSAPTIPGLATAA